MDTDLIPRDPYVEYAQTTLTEASPERAVVEQPAASFLDNHVGVRHASALFTAGHEAARALVLATLGGRDDVRAELVQSDVHYSNVGFGTVTSEAEPVGDGWSAAGDGQPVELEALVTGRDEAGKTVFTVSERWSLTPSA